MNFGDQDWMTADVGVTIKSHGIDTWVAEARELGNYMTSLGCRGIPALVIFLKKKMT